METTTSAGELTKLAPETVEDILAQANRKALYSNSVDYRDGKSPYSPDILTKCGFVRKRYELDDCYIFGPKFGTSS